MVGLERRDRCGGPNGSPGQDHEHTEGRRTRVVHRKAGRVRVSLPILGGPCSTFVAGGSWWPSHRSGDGERKGSSDTDRRDNMGMPAPNGGWCGQPSSNDVAPCRRASTSCRGPSPSPRPCSCATSSPAPPTWGPFASVDLLAAIVLAAVPPARRRPGRRPLPGPLALRLLRRGRPPRAAPCFVTTVAVLPGQPVLLDRGRAARPPQRHHRRRAARAARSWPASATCGASSSSAAPARRRDLREGARVRRRRGRRPARHRHAAQPGEPLPARRPARRRPRQAQPRDHGRPGGRRPPRPRPAPPSAPAPPRSSSPSRAPAPSCSASCPQLALEADLDVRDPPRRSPSCSAATSASATSGRSPTPTSSAATRSTPTSTPSPATSPASGCSSPAPAARSAASCAARSPASRRRRSSCSTATSRPCTASSCASRAGPCSTPQPRGRATSATATASTRSSPSTSPRSCSTPPRSSTSRCSRCTRARRVKTNVFGTQLLLDARRRARRRALRQHLHRQGRRPHQRARLHQAHRRAAHRRAWPTSAAGTYLSVRFGNVLGSRGCVLTAFRAQVEAGGPITVTDPDVTRYFMTVEEAVQLVIQAGAVGAHGEALVLDMGEPVRIDDVARRLRRPVRAAHRDRLHRPAARREAPRGAARGRRARPAPGPPPHLPRQRAPHRSGRTRSPSPSPAPTPTRWWPRCGASPPPARVARSRPPATTERASAPARPAPPPGGSRPAHPRPPPPLRPRCSARPGARRRPRGPPPPPGTRRRRRASGSMTAPGLTVAKLPSTARAPTTALVLTWT